MLGGQGSRLTACGVNIGSGSYSIQWRGAVQADTAAISG